MRPSTRYSLAWCISLTLLLVPWSWVLLYGLSRAQMGGESGAGILALLGTILLGPAVIAVLLWKRRRLGWALSMVAALLLFLFFGSWWVSLSDHTLGSSLIMGTPLAATFGILLLGWNAETRNDFPARSRSGARSERS